MKASLPHSDPPSSLIGLSFGVSFRNSPPAHQLVVVQRLPLPFEKEAGPSKGFEQLISALDNSKLMYYSLLMLLDTAE